MPRSADGSGYAVDARLAIPSLDFPESRCSRRSHTYFLFDKANICLASSLGVVAVARFLRRAPPVTYFHEKVYRYRIAIVPVVSPGNPSLVGVRESNLTPAGRSLANSRSIPGRARPAGRRRQAAPAGTFSKPPALPAGAKARSRAGCTAERTGRLSLFLFLGHCSFDAPGKGTLGNTRPAARSAT